MIGRQASETVGIALVDYGVPLALNSFISRQHCEIIVGASGRVTITALTRLQSVHKLIRINSGDGNEGTILAKGVPVELHLDDRVTLLVSTQNHAMKSLLRRQNLGYNGYNSRVMYSAGGGYSSCGY
jgi:hypothetical protein